MVFLMHGMIVSAVDFLILGPYENKALAYALSDAGYDVWLGNNRGQNTRINTPPSLPTTTNTGSSVGTRLVAMIYQRSSIKFLKKLVRNLCITLGILKTLLGPILKYSPAGMSFRQLFHFLQLVNSKKFQQYDHKSEENLVKYKFATPPEYHTSNIRVKMQILYGTHDLLSSPKDVKDLIYYFGNQVIDVVKLDEWNHVNFIYGKEANKMAYQKIIEVMRKHEM